MTMRNEKSIHKSSIVQISPNRRFLWINFNHLSEANEKRKNYKSRTTFWWYFESSNREKKCYNWNAHSNSMAFWLAGWNTLYDFGSPNISSWENWICDNDNWCGGRFSVVLFDFFLVCSPLARLFFTIWFKSFLVDYCGEYFTRLVVLHTSTLLVKKRDPLCAERPICDDQNDRLHFDEQ